VKVSAMKISKFFLFLFTGICLAATCEAAEIQLIEDRGVYSVPVKINGILTLSFILDSGASEVLVPSDVVSTLLRSGTILESDFLPGDDYTLADGSLFHGYRFLLRHLQIGDYAVDDVVAVVSPATGSLLLGQSFLKRLASWSIDNKRNVLIIGATAYYHSPIPIADSEITEFIERYFVLLNSGNLVDIIQLYADKVDYFAAGTVSREFIFRDKKRFYERWPDIEYLLSGDVDIDRRDCPVSASFLLNFRAHNPGTDDNVSGIAKNILTLEKTKDELKIVSEKQMILKRYDR